MSLRFHDLARAPQRLGWLLRTSARRWVGFDLKRFDANMDWHLRRQKILEHHQVTQVVDGGANQGQFAHTLRRYGYRQAVLSIEPGSAAFEQLARAALGDPRWSVRQAALGAQSGTGSLRVTQNSVSSTMHPSTQIGRTVRGSETVGEEQVDVITLDALAAEDAFSPEGALLKLDLQGGESQALDGATDTLKKVALVEIEIGFQPLYDEQAAPDEVFRFFRNREFVPVSIQPNTLDPATGYVLEADAIFARA